MEYTITCSSIQGMQGLNCQHKTCDNTPLAFQINIFLCLDKSSLKYDALIICKEFIVNSLKISSCLSNFLNNIHKSFWTEQILKQTIDVDTLGVFDWMFRAS